jgi:agmatine deiminase
MITDLETDFVYFSDLLPQEHPEFFKKLEAILRRKKIGYGLLSHTKDIWCRDYMPIQISKDRFVQFKYDPVYPPVTDAAKACEAIGIKPVVSDIKIDGGNIVKSRTKVIMTSRIVNKNREHYRKEQLIEKLKKLLDVKQVIIIPQCPGDKFGHADGMVRFYDGVKDEMTAFASDYCRDLSFKKKFYKALKGQGVWPSFIPYNPYNNKGYLDATGVYINYLQIGKLVIYPIYGLKEDDLAEKWFTSFFGSNAMPIKANAIAREGGVLNCVTWNIKLSSGVVNSSYA